MKVVTKPRRIRGYDRVVFCFKFFLSPQKKTVEMASALIFNENEGYVDGILRGYYSGILNSSQYLNFTQCETLEGKINKLLNMLYIKERKKDLRLQLGATDYGSLLQNEPSPIATSTISEKLTQSLVEEFQYVRSNAVQPLSKFLDYIT